jgi:carbon monoxide dehydrogenase subunit G
MAIAAVQLELKPAASGESSIDLTIDLQVYGKLASMGHNIVERRAREILNEFADNVESRLSTVNPQTGAGDATVAESESAEPSFETRR